VAFQQETQCNSESFHS